MTSTSTTSSTSAVAAAVTRRRWTAAEPAKCVFLLFFLFFAGMSNWAVVAYTHDIVPREPLPDMVFRVIAEQTWASIVGDICVGVCVASLAVLLVVHTSRAVVLRRVVFIAATLYWMRSLALASTQLPSAYMNNDVKCRPRVNSSLNVFLERLLEQTIRLGFQSKEGMLCGDLLFSGHTLVMVVCTMSVGYYLPTRVKWLQYPLHLVCTFGMLCMIISRTHYTIDVVVAFWLSGFVFRVYHAYCEVDIYMERRKSVLFSWWPCFLIDWLEENIVPGRIENHVAIPFVRNLDKTIDSATSSARQHQKQISISSSSTLPMP